MRISAKPAGESHTICLNCHLRPLMHGDEGSGSGERAPMLKGGEGRSVLEPKACPNPGPSAGIPGSEAVWDVGPYDGYEMEDGTLPFRCSGSISTAFQGHFRASQIILCALESLDGANRYRTFRYRSMNIGRPCERIPVVLWHEVPPVQTFRSPTPTLVSGVGHGENWTRIIF